MDLFDRTAGYITLFEEIHSQAAEYISDIEDVLESTIAADIKSTLQCLYKEIAAVKSISRPNDALECIFRLLDVYEHLGACEEAIRRLLVPVCNIKYIEKKSQNMSRTFVNELKLKKSRINHIFNTYNQEATADYAKFDELFVVLKKEQISKLAAFIETFDAKIISRFYMFLLHMLILRGAPKLLNKVEQLKDRVLGSAPIQLDEGVDAMLRTVVSWGLIPDSYSRPLDKLLSEGFNVDTVEQLRARFSVLLVRRSFDAKIEISESKFLNPEEFSKIYYTESHPVTESTVQSLNNIYEVSPPTIGRETPLFEFHENLESDECVVVETNNGTQWHLLVRKYGEKTVPHAHAKRILAGIPGRPYHYQKLASGIILGAALNPNLRSLYSEFQSTTNPRDIVGLKERFRKHWDYHWRPDVDFQALVTDRKIIFGVVSAVLYKQFSIDPKFEEQAISFARVVHEIAGAYLKEITARVEKQGPPDEIYKKYEGKELSRQLKGFYDDLHGAVFDALTNRRPSIWNNLDLSFKEFAMCRLMK